MNTVLNKIFLVFSIMISTNCFCQDKESTDITDVIKATFFNPGISYEKRIGKFQSLYAQVFMNTSFFLDYSDALGFTSGIHFDPGATLQYRYYYNSAARGAKGKRIEMNSLNYVSFILETTLITQKILLVDYIKKDHHAVKHLGIAWGFQRNYKSRFSLDLNVGLGYVFAKTTEIDNGQWVTKSIGEFTTLGQVDLGFWLNKRN
ncbi:MAG: hypothetical protein ABI691_18450 [Ginsengibacter sp.]